MIFGTNRLLNNFCENPVFSMSIYRWIAAWINFWIAYGVNYFLGIVYGVNLFIRIVMCRIVDC